MADQGLEKFPQQNDVAPIDIRPGYPGAFADRYPPPYGYGYPAEDGQLNLNQIWRLVRKRKWMIIGIALIVTTIVTIESYRAKSIYRASAVVEIGRDTTALAKSDNVIIQNDDPLYISMATSKVIIKSPPVLEQVVTSLRLDQNSRFLDINGKKSLFEALRDIGVRAHLVSADPASSPVFEVAEYEQPRERRELSQKERDRLAPYLGVIESNVSADEIPDTRTMNISFTHTDAEIAAAVANSIAESYISFDFQNKTENVTKASNWLDRSTRELKANVEKAERALADYTRDHNIFSLEGKETLTTDKLSRLHDQATRAETDRILKASLYEEVRQGRVAQIPEGFADPKLVELQKQLGALSTRAAELSAVYGPKHPEVIKISRQIASIQQQIDDSRAFLEEKLKADYERALRDEQALKEALARAKGEAVQQNQDAIQFNILKQDVDTAKSLYTEFLQKMKQADLEVAQQKNNLRLIAPARVSWVPVGPNRFRQILTGLFLSIAAGIGLAYFLDYLDNTIKNVEDVNRYMQLPALGVIPAIALINSESVKGRGGARAFLKGSRSVNTSETGLPSIKPGQLMAVDKRSSAAEAYRALRTSVMLSSAGSPPKTILVTSGQAGEGKTTTTINTAISLAQLGASVLIIDCDLRRPSVHKVFGIDSAPGVSTYLSRNVEIESLIQKLQIPNLSFLPCGHIPPNPAELISSQKMKEMLAMLAERFDHILIDSPPLINVTDPVILSTLVDGVILVIHGGKSPRSVAWRARQELTSVGAKIFGVVLNNVNLQREGYDEYHYYRHYSGYYESTGTEPRDSL